MSYFSHETIGQNLELNIAASRFCNSSTWSAPYVRELEKKELKNNVLKNEPHVALFVENDNPLIFYAKIAELAKKYLNKNGLLFFEINQYLGTETIDLVNKKGLKNIQLKKDMFGNDRIIVASK